MITIIYFIIFFCATYLPAIRIGGIPLLISDFFLGFLFLISLLNIRNLRKDNRAFYSSIFLIPFIWGLVLVCFRGIFDNFYLKDLVLPIINFKMFVFVFTTLVLWEKINKNILIKLVLSLVIIQLIVATLQKLGVPGFSSGMLYSFAVNNAMNNVYYGGNVAYIIATHLNVTFRPIGFLGSPTILATFFLVIFYLQLLINNSKTLIGLIYYSILLCFSKITIISFLFYDSLIKPIFNKNLKKLMISVFVTIFICVGFLIFINYNQRMNEYVMLFINGDDYGVTHRISVIDFMQNMSVTGLLFGTGGEPPFIFDSGFLLTIFRFGIIYLALVYWSYYKIFKIFSFKNSHLFLIIIFVFADLTIGSFHNQMFFYLIGFSIIFTLQGIQKSNCDDESIVEKY
ncbi:hypothetical protein J8631_06850 [Serratia fonticola]|uniref:Uncharacterized protein n=1 Tax=Serratia fonticola TaxID=47917 RepID=A0AAW3WT61_SERFO|nr:hypothetical protein [Serratia fonticola]MBC3212852.1 hypothetical protein [Serratia fonticola]MBP1035276.1 hypothetical protein [Serratia fonticola]PAA95937.1 hypothetical protein CJJ13_19915 [Serratia fonticola]